ncbi:unnamed protein product [Darwinula stevensoni]|uniref:glutathione transferase n=1 Tax=Darwinula stevensoni TaxID=69355 RepID=A0A7R9A2S9_9CRUS|nr:unnamed protein product [Darwinula stevensoni]CAG0890308.1 unnamed protein product [Darwinula stevensoni]
MAVKYKLIYFDVAGRGEVIRLLLHQSGVEFEDHRITRDEWPNLKLEMPFGQIPVLQVFTDEGTKVLAQSNAIARFIARSHGMDGKDTWESAQCDMLVDVMGDMQDLFIKWRFSSEEEKEANKTKLFDSVPLFFTRMVKFIENNPSKSGYLVGSELTWPDVYLAQSLDVLKGVEPNVALAHPKIQELQEKVWSQPRIKAYLTKQGRLS